MQDGAQENGGNGDAQNLTEAKPLPVLSVQRDRLTFVSGDSTYHLTLGDVLKGADSQGPVGMLLYALVLKLSDVDATLKAALQRSQAQVKGLGEIAQDPGKLVAELLKQFQNFAINGPGTPPKVQP